MTHTSTDPVQDPALHDISECSSDFSSDREISGDGALSVKTIAQLIRARHSADLDLDVFNHLIEFLNRGDHVNPTHKPEPAFVPHDESSSNQSNALSTNQPSAARDDDVLATDRYMEQVLRALVRNPNLWEEECPRIIGTIQNQGGGKLTSNSAARLIETMILIGRDVKETVSMIILLAKHGCFFWKDLHAAVKTQILLRGFKFPEISELAKQIWTWVEIGQATALEKLFVFAFSKQSQRNPRELLEFFMEHQASIDQALIQYRMDTVSKDELYAKAVRQAMKCGDTETARQLYQRLSPTSPWYLKLKDLNVQFSVHSDQHFRVRDTVTRQSTAELLNGLEAFLLPIAEEQTSQEDDTTISVYLKELSKRPPRDAEQLDRLGLILAAVRTRVACLPYMGAVLQHYALTFSSPALEHALWTHIAPQQVGEYDREANIQNNYWEGVAQLHIYIATDQTDDRLLLSARTKVVEAQKALGAHTPAAWRELCDRAVDWIRKSPFFNEMKRRKLHLSLKVFGQLKFISSQDIENYIANKLSLDRTVGEHLVAICRYHHLHALESSIVLKMAGQAGLTNDELQQIWSTGGKLSSHDLSWRVASILNARKSLIPQVVSSWEVSGENRKVTTAVDLSEDALFSTLTYSLSEKDQQITRLFYDFALKLIELRYEIYPQDFRTVRRSQLDLFKHSFQLLADSQGIGAVFANKRIKQHAMSNAFAKSIFPFGEIRPHGQWGTLLHVMVYRFGIVVWGWNGSGLFELADNLFTSAASTHSGSPSATKYIKWLRSLSGKERDQWQRIKQVFEKNSLESIQLLLCKQVVRMTTMVLPAHYEALTTLQEMRTDLRIIRDLEQFILSAEYSSLRRKLGREHKVLLPKSITDIDVRRKD